MKYILRAMITVSVIFSASILQAGAVIVDSISGDWNQDGIPDRAFLLGTPGDVRLDLGIWLGNAAGEDTDLAFLIENFATRSSPDSTAPYPPGNGDSSFFLMVDGIRFAIIDFNSAKGWMAHRTLALNAEGQPVVVEYAREVFMTEAARAVRVCTANLEAGQGTVINRETGVVEAGFPVERGSILASDWHLASIDFPDSCGAP